MTKFELDPREADAFVRGMDARRELVYRIAIRSLSERCRGDRAFRRRTDELLARFLEEMPAVLKEAAALERELGTAAAAS